MDYNPIYETRSQHFVGRQRILRASQYIEQSRPSLNRLKTEMRGSVQLTERQQRSPELPNIQYKQRVISNFERPMKSSRIKTEVSLPKSPLKSTSIPRPLNLKINSRRLVIEVPPCNNPQEVPMECIKKQMQRIYEKANLDPRKMNRIFGKVEIKKDLEFLIQLLKKN